MQDQILPKDLHPDIAKIIMDFAEESGIEIFHSNHDCDSRLKDLSDQYTEYKPGVVKDTSRK